MHKSTYTHTHTHAHMYMLFPEEPPQRSLYTSTPQLRYTAIYQLKETTRPLIPIPANMEPYIEFIGTLQNSGFWLVKVEVHWKPRLFGPGLPLTSEASSGPGREPEFGRLTSHLVWGGPRKVLASLSKSPLKEI